MSDENPIISRYHHATSEELGGAVEQAMQEKSAVERRAWVALFRNRALNFIRRGSSLELRREAMALNKHLYSPAGTKLQQTNPAYFSSLSTIADMLSTAGQRTDGTFISAVLSSHSKYAQRILEQLARATPNQLPRREILAHLRKEDRKLSESHFTHILADLEEAGVVVRIRREGTKEVVVALDSAGRDLIQAQLEPQWFVAAAQVLDDVARGKPAPPPAKVSSMLEKANVPSSLVVTRVHDLLEAMSGVAVAST